MKPFRDLTQSGRVLHTLVSQSGWSAPRIGAAVGSAQQRLREPAPAQPARPWNLAQRVPELVPMRPPTAPSSLRVQLASGRSVRVRMPAVAARRDLEAVAGAAQENARRQSATLKQHAQALDTLHSADSALEQRLQTVQAQADLALLAALRGQATLADGLTETMQRVATQEESGRALATRVRYQAQLARGQHVRSAVSAMQGAAYGERGNVFATNNLLLGGSELLWGSIDSWLRRLGLWANPEPVPLTWLGPLIGLLVGHATLGQQQLERFVTGQLTLPAPGGEFDAFSLLEGKVDLRAHIAPRSWEEFRKKAVVPATAQVADNGAFGLAIAWVEFGTLRVVALSSPAPTGALQITWTVDMEAAGG